MPPARGPPRPGEGGLVGVGMPEENAETTSGCLAWPDLHGVAHRAVRAGRSGPACDALRPGIGRQDRMNRVPNGSFLARIRQEKL
jgi:hypothetical protein